MWHQIYLSLVLLLTFVGQSQPQLEQEVLYLYIGSDECAPKLVSNCSGLGTSIHRSASTPNKPEEEFFIFEDQINYWPFMSIYNFECPIAIGL